MPAGATLTLQATLAPPAAGSGTPGADLTSATMVLPPTITVSFNQTSATITALGAATVTVYGTTVDITWPTRVVSYTAGTPVLVIAGHPDAATFLFKTVKSTLFVPSGTAKLNGAAWTLPVATTTINALGEASGAGSLLLELNDGATAHSMPTGNLKVVGWAVSIDPTQLFILIGAQGTQATTSYRLWPGAAPATLHSSVAFLRPAGLLASFLARPGSEVLSVGGGATAFLDRPLASDGGALPIAGNATLTQTVTASTTRLAILGSAPNSATLPTFSIALENALIGIRAPGLFWISGPIVGTNFQTADVALLMATRWLLPTLARSVCRQLQSGPSASRGYRCRGRRHGRRDCVERSCGARTGV